MHLLLLLATIAALIPAPQAPALVPAAQGDLSQPGRWDRYTIDATLDPDAGTLGGTLTLEYTNRDSAPHPQIYFHLYPNLRPFAGKLTVDSAIVDGAPARSSAEGRGYLLRVDLPQPLAPGQSATIGLRFATRAPQSVGGKVYAAFNREKDVLALASAYPLLPIVRAGVWDTAPPDDLGDFVVSETALYDLTLRAPTGWTLLASGVPVERSVAGAMQTLRFVSGPVRELTVVATRLPSVEQVVDGTLVRLHHPFGQAAAARLALRTAVDAVRIFNRRFGQLPYADIDIVAIDARTFYGVEYPGLIMLDRGLFARSGQLESVTAHEVAHQWFFGVVGGDQQREPWIDEGFASYAQVIYREETGGAVAAERELDQFRAVYRAARAARRDGIVDRPASALHGRYTLLAYAKPALFLHALRQKIGEAAFDAAIHDFYASNRYALVSGGDLLASAERGCDCQLDSFYRDWIETAAPVAIP